MLALLALVIAIAVVAVYARRNSATRRCRWRQSKAGSKGALIKYNCVTCGAEAFRSNGRPDRCLSSLNRAGL